MSILELIEDIKRMLLTMYLEDDKYMLWKVEYIPPDMKYRCKCELIELAKECRSVEMRLFDRRHYAYKSVCNTKWLLQRMFELWGSTNKVDRVEYVKEFIK